MWKLRRYVILCGTYHSVANLTCHSFGWKLQQSQQETLSSKSSVVFFVWKPLKHYNALRLSSFMLYEEVLLNDYIYIYIFIYIYIYIYIYRYIYIYIIYIYIYIYIYFCSLDLYRAYFVFKEIQRRLWGDATLTNLVLLLPCLLNL